MVNYYNLRRNETFLVSQKAFIISHGKLLILKLPNTGGKHWAGKWNLPGGLLEMNESLEKGLAREVREETGLRVLVKRLICASDFRYNNFVFKDGRKLKARIFEIGFLCECQEGKISVSEEHADYKWVARAELKRIDFTPDSKQLVEDYLHRF